MAQLTLSQLLVQQTKDQILSFALGIATAIGLPVTSWQAGDPTRSLYNVEAETLETLENVVVGYISSGFLDYASGPWLQILALEVFNVTVPAATPASTPVTLTNSGGGVFIINPGDITLKSSVTGQTYHNTTGGTLPSGSAGSPTTLSLTFTADVAGSVGTVGAGQIDTIVTTMLGVTCSNPAAAVGTDTWSDATIRQQCRNKLGSLSPNGPASAYSYVALNSALTGVTSPTKARVFASSATGVVTLYVAGSSGPIPAGDLTAVTNAVIQWAVPLCITPLVLNANPVTVPITYTLYLYKSVNQTTAAIQAAVQTALTNLFAATPIGGDNNSGSGGFLYVSNIAAAIKIVYPQAFAVTVSTPSGDTALNNGDVPVLGTLTGTINFVTNPQ